MAMPADHRPVISSDRVSLRWLLGALLGCVALRLVWLGRGISGDEPELIGHARVLWEQGIRQWVARGVLVPPLSPLLLGGWLLIHQSEVWIRLYFVGFGVLACWGVYLLGSRLVDRAFGVQCLLAAACSPLLVWSSQYIRNYIDAACWTVFAVWCGIGLLQDPRRTRRWVGYAVMGVLAMYTFPFVAPILAVMALALLAATARQRAGRGSWLISHLVMAAAFLPGLFVAVQQLTSNSSGRLSFWQSHGYQLGGVHLGISARALGALAGIDPFAVPSGLSRSVPPALLGLAVLGALSGAVWLGWTAVTALTRRATRVPFAGALLLGLAVAPILFGMVVGERMDVFPRDRYLSASHALVIPMLVAVTAAWGRRVLGMRWALAPLLLVYLIRLPFVYGPEFATADAERYLRTHARAGDCIAAFGDRSSGVDGATSLELGQFLEARDPRTGNYQPLSPASAARLERSVTSCGNLWLFFTDDNYAVFQARSVIQRSLAGWHPVQTLAQWRGVTLIRATAEPPQGREIAQGPR